MQIVGVDFTSAPGARKQITVARVTLKDATVHVGQLTMLALERFTSFEAFEQFLQCPGEHWFGGFDFPFALPAEFVQSQGWPERWDAYVSVIAALGKLGFESAIEQYQAVRPLGKKQCFRLTDRLTRSSSPMKLYYPPVGKMFFQGAPRLLMAGISVHPQRPLERSSEDTVLKHAVEAYPALVVRRVFRGNRAPYKTDTPSQDNAERSANRGWLVNALETGEGLAEFQLQVQIPDALKVELLADATGDALDALLCAFQAAWAYRQGTPAYGIPSVYDPNEGWIVDPDLASGLKDLELTLPSANVN